MRRLLTVVALALLALFAGTGVASAHAELDSSNPADGADLSAAPAALTLSFSEPVELPETRVTLTDNADRPFTVAAARAVTSTASGVTAVAVPLPALARGSYRLAWRTVSADDLHVTSGVIAFGVQQDAPPAAGSSDPPADPAESVARWIGFAGLSALLGAAALAGLIGGLPDGPRRAAARRTLAGLAVAGGGLAVAGDALLLLVQATAAAGPGGHIGDALARLLSTPPRAPRWWAREVSLLVLLGCAVAARRRVRTGGVPRAALVLGTAAAVGVATTGALLGHSVGSGPLRVATDAVHGLAAMTWAGGLLAVSAVLLRRPRDAAARAVLARFSLLAMACVAVLTVTGLMLTDSGVASLDALLLSHFGQALLVKVGLMAVALAVALVNTLAVFRRWSPPRRGLVLEAGVLVAALGAAAVLAASPPAAGPSWRAPEEPVAQLSATAGDLVESIAVTPNRPGGPNVVTVRVLDTRRPAPAPIRMVTVRVGGVAGTAAPTDPGTFVLVTDRISATGPLPVTVTVARAGLAPEVVDYAWTVTDPTVPRRSPVYSAAPISAPLGAAAWAVGLLAAGVAALLLWRRRSAVAARAGLDDVLLIGPRGAGPGVPDAVDLHRGHHREDHRQRGEHAGDGPDRSAQGGGAGSGHRAGTVVADRRARPLVHGHERDEQHEHPRDEDE